MSIISSLSQVRAALHYQPRAGAPASAAQDDKTSPSALVRLSPEGLAASQAGAASAAGRLPTSLRYHELGLELLGAFGAGAVTPDAAVPEETDNRFSLDIALAGGRKVALVLANVGDAMFVQAEAQPDLELGADEREALAGLAKGFQDAIDGMAQDLPRLRLGELARFSHPLVQALDFRAAVTLPGEPPEKMSLDLHIGAERRTLGVAGPQGKLDLGIDSGKLELLGSKQQQAEAIDTYLKQFDQAARRGHADPALSAMFKDAFADLSRTATRDDPAAAPGMARPLSRTDRAVLTGLADFEASVVATPRQDNPARLDEVTGFRWEAAQRTRIEEEDGRRTLSQKQTSRLSAQFHEALRAGDTLAFDFRSETQNYRYHQIDDSAGSSVELGYQDGRLQSARLEQSVSQSERIRKYVLGRVMSDQTIPQQHTIARDLMNALALYQPGQAGEAESEEQREARIQASLDMLADELVLLGDRNALAEREARL